MLAAGAVASTSDAAVNSCFIVQDEKGDGTGTFLGDPATAPNDPAWDITSADVASDGKTLTGIVRVDKLAKSAGTSPTGVHWRIDFDVAGGSNRIFVQGRATPFGDTFSAGYVGTTSTSYAGTATGVIDLDKNEVRVSFPVSAAAAQAVIKNGTKISGIVAAAGRFINTAGGNPSLSDFSDTAEGTKTYTVGEPSCVVIGK